MPCLQCVGVMAVVCVAFIWASVQFCQVSQRVSEHDVQGSAVAQAVGNKAAVTRFVRVSVAVIVPRLVKFPLFPTPLFFLSCMNPFPTMKPSVRPGSGWSKLRAAAEPLTPAMPLVAAASLWEYSSPGGPCVASFGRAQSNTTPVHRGQQTERAFHKY